MTNRSMNSAVTFTQPFAIGAQTEKLPAGTYNVTIDEELIDGLSFAAYRRTSTIIEVPSIGTASATRQYLHVAADDLDAALQRDRRRAESGVA